MAKSVTLFFLLLSGFFVVPGQNMQPSLRYSLGSHPMQYRKIETSLYPKYYEMYQKCRNGICPQADDYPEQEILRIMKNTKNLQGLFGIVLNSTYDTTQIGSRNNFDTEGKPKRLCSTESSETVTPKVMRNTALKWKYVVNVEGYYQRFTAEYCRVNSMHRNDGRANDSCTELNFRCNQQYQEVYLLTYENNSIDFDKFNIPTTCQCECG